MDGIRGQPQKKVKFSFLMIFCAEVMWEMKLRGLKLPMFGPQIEVVGRGDSYAFS